MKALMLALIGAALGGTAFAEEAAQPSLEELLWVARPLVLFADADTDPRLERQLEELERGMAELEARDVVILIDTEPGERSELRTRFRPRGFNVVLVDKGGDIIYRKPDPITVREVTRLIDRTPLRQQELEAEQGRVAR